MTDRLNKLNGAEIINLNSPEGLERRRLLEAAHANTEHVAHLTYDQQPDRNNIVYPDFGPQKDNDYQEEKAV